MNKNRILAKITGYSLLLMAVIAGFAFGFVLPKVFNSGQLDFVSNLEMILALPMAIGELGLAVWLIIKGGKA